MGVLDKIQSKNIEKSKNLELTQEELKFILAKLRTADYKGNEFEMFYQVFVKIQEKLG